MYSSHAHGIIPYWCFHIVNNNTPEDKPPIPDAMLGDMDSNRKQIELWLLPWQLNTIEHVLVLPGLNYQRRGQNYRVLRKIGAKMSYPIDFNETKNVGLSWSIWEIFDCRSTEVKWWHIDDYRTPGNTSGFSCIMVLDCASWIYGTSHSS